MSPSVVIVDDHAGFRAALRRLLEAEGLVVVGEAADGDEGVAVVTALDPDVAVVDVQLPLLDGFGVVAALTAQRTRTRVVLTSTRPAADYGARLDSSSGIPFIAKADLTAAAVTAAASRGQ